MKHLLSIVLSFVFIIFAAGSLWAKEWRGIVPMHSTRTDVTRILGDSPDANELRANYSFENEEVNIAFSSKLTDSCAEKLPHDTVLFIRIRYRQSLPKFESRFNDLNFRKVDSPDGHHTGYVNEKEGIIHSFFGDRLVQTDYIASSEDSHLCQSLYSNPEGFVPNVLVNYVRRFDQYGDLRFSEEKLRLDQLPIELGDSKKTVAIIRCYGEKSRAAKRLKRVKDYLIKRHGVNPKKIITEYGGEGDFMIDIYLVPEDTKIKN